MEFSDDELVVASWNVPHNGLPSGGKGDNRPAKSKVIARYVPRPHVFFRQELKGAHEDGRAELYREAREDMGGLHPIASRPQEGRSQKPVGVMVHQKMFELTHEFEHVLQWKTIINPRVRLKVPPSLAPARMAGTAMKAVNLASAHLCHFDPDSRATEARRLTTLADHGRSAIIGMDANSYPHSEQEAHTLPDWDKVEDRVHYQHRTIERDGRRVSDSRPDEILSGGPRPVFVDVALHAGVLTPTASLWRTDQGPRQRIDRIYITPDLVPALRRVEVVDTDEVKAASDHALVIAVFGLPELVRALTPAA
ncbi:endonuclease/exonuclease/phosphatase family protein [Streptomyces sp. SID625]|nr:endonuclease/exonuclease/phosphatase family protein [Streptomyces sp. SID625]